MSYLLRRTAQLYSVHDAGFYLAETIASLQGRVPVFVFVNRLPFYSAAGEWQKAAEFADDDGSARLLGELCGLPSVVY